MKGLYTVALIITFSSSVMAYAALPNCNALAEANSSRLMQYLKDGQNGNSDPRCVEYAIRRLGDEKIIEAIPVLASYLAFHRPETEREKMGMGGALGTPGNEFPAVWALSQLGQKALPGLTHMIETEQSGSRASQNAIYTIVKILSSGVDTIHFLKRTAAVAKSTAARQRLSEATRQTLTWCGSAERPACESAL